MQRTTIVNLKHRPELRRALAHRDECEGVVRIDRCGFQSKVITHSTAK